MPLQFVAQGPMLIPSVGGVAWNPLDKDGSNVTLSNSNLTMAADATNGGGVRSTTSHASGKFYFEARIDTASTGVAGIIAIADAACSKVGSSYQLFTGMTAVGVRVSTGKQFANNAEFATFDTLVAGDYIGLAMDLGGGATYYMASPSNTWATWSLVNGFSYATSIDIDAHGGGFNGVTGPFYIFGFGIGSANGGGTFGCTINTTGPFQNPNAAHLASIGYGSW